MKRLARLGRRLADWIPVTPLGAIVALASAYALVEFGMGQQDLVILVLGYGVLALCVLALVIVLGASLAIKLRLRHVELSSEREFETSRESPTGYELSAFRFVPLVQVRESWRVPDEVRVAVNSRQGRLHEVATFATRGEVREVVRRIVVQDAFGLARLGLRDRRAVHFTVSPHVGGMKNTPLLVTLSGGDEFPHPMGLEDGDRLDLRRYAPGDPVRFIHWKVFARTRELVVRVPERALTRARRTIAYLVSGEGDEASAACARVAVTERALGDEWVFGADGSGDCETIHDATNAIVRSVEHKGGVGLAAFLERAKKSGPASAILFVPARPGPWLARVVTIARGRPGRLRAVIGVDGVNEGTSLSFVNRLLTRARGEAGTARALREVSSTLERAGVDVIVIDRVTGRVLGTPQLRVQSRVRGHAA